MGVFIYLDISGSVTQAEWEKVYEETLALIKNFPLAEKINADIHGVDTICLVKSKEHYFPSVREAGKGKLGWAADGDLETFNVAETYFLPRDLIGSNEVDENAGDAMLGAFPSYLNYRLKYSWDDERFQHVYGIWGWNKTQGEPYHMYLLSVACLIEARLGTKAYVYGDITREQCMRAVEIANEFLENKIEMPDRCYTDRLMKRVLALDLPENEKVAVFETFYLGTKSAEFGDALRQHFSKKTLYEFWTDRFNRLQIETIEFDISVREYLLWGFEIEKLCTLVNFKDEHVTAEQIVEAAKQDAAEVVCQLMDRKREEIAESYAEYDINDLDDLIRYKKGDTIRPGLAESLGASRRVLDDILSGELFTVLSNKSAKRKLEWLIDHNEFILINKSDWEKVYRNLEENPDSFARYYPLMRVNAGRGNLAAMTRALAVNDELYLYSKELANM